MPIIIDITQQPNGILFQGSGTLNIASFGGRPSFIAAGAPATRFNAVNGFVNATPGGQSVKWYRNLFAPIQIGLENTYFSQYNVINYTSNNKTFAVGLEQFFLPQTGIGFYPMNYGSNQNFSWSFLLTNQTYSSLGITPQVITRSWTGNTGVQETLTINITPPPQPRA